MNPVTREQRDEAIAHFKYEGTLVKDCPYGSGHINDTFLLIFEIAEMGRIKVILQRMNSTAFPKPVEVMENITGVTSFLKKKIIENGGDPERETLNVQRCRIWHGSVKRPRGQMPTLPPGLQSFWRRHACPAQNRCGSWHPCRQQTPCCWKLRCTALWLRCGTQRKNMCSCCVPWCGRAAAHMKPTASWKFSSD